MKKVGGVEIIEEGFEGGKKKRRPIDNCGFGGGVYRLYRGGEEDFV